MKVTTLDNAAKFFYDCGKLSFAVLVVGVVAHKPISISDLIVGTVTTLFFLFCGLTINEATVKS